MAAYLHPRMLASFHSFTEKKCHESKTSIEHDRRAHVDWH